MLGNARPLIYTLQFSERKLEFFLYCLNLGFETHKDMYFVKFKECAFFLRCMKNESFYLSC